VVDLSRLSSLLYTIRSYGAPLASARELGNVAADDLPGHRVRIPTGEMQPAEEMRKPSGIGPLRVNGTIALAELSQELIA
jgi:hypothetical protein